MTHECFAAYLPVFLPVCLCACPWHYTTNLLLLLAEQRWLKWTLNATWTNLLALQPQKWPRLPACYLSIFFFHERLPPLFRKPKIAEMNLKCHSQWIDLLTVLYASECHCGITFLWCGWGRGQCGGTLTPVLQVIMPDFFFFILSVS